MGIKEGRTALSERKRGNNLIAPKVDREQLRGREKSQQDDLGQCTFMTPHFDSL